MAYKENLEALKKINKILALQVFRSDLNKDFSGETLEEAQEWFQSLNVKNKSVIYLFGIGKGYFYQAAEQWLQDSHDNILVILEDDTTVWRSLLEETHAEKLLQNRQVILVPISVDNIDDWSSSSLMQFADLTAVITVHPQYKKIRPESCNMVEKSINMNAIFSDLLYKEGALEGGFAFYPNFYENIFKMHGASNFNSLEGAFKGMPIIISGAGPSLDKNIEALKTAKHRALIFAGGSALNVLSHYNLCPHIAVGVDPSIDEIDRFANHGLYEVPIVNITRLNWHANNYVHGPSLFAYDTAGGYGMQSWLLKTHKIKKGISLAGCSVTTSATHLAMHLGCNPIIYVGVDLASTTMRRYAAGVFDDPKRTKEELHLGDMTWEGGFEATDIHGEKIYTQWNWKLESEWLSQYAKAHPDTTFINATEGGIGFKDVPNIPLKDVLEQYCSKKRDMTMSVHTAIQNADTISMHPDAIKQQLLAFQDSARECSVILNKMIDYRMVALFSNIGKYFLEPFDLEQDALIQNLSNAEPGSDEQEKYIKEFKVLQESMTQVNEVCTKSLESMMAIGDRLDDNHTTWGALAEDLGHQDAYKYIFNDVDRVLVLAELRLLTIKGDDTSSLINTLYAALDHSEVQVKKIKRLISFAEMHINLIEETIGRHSEKQVLVEH